MKITVLIEDTRIDKRLFKELGLSLFIETPDARILMDTGQSGKFIDNTEKLGVDISQIEACVISHAHYDHGGGLERFFCRNDLAPVFLHQKAMGQYVKLPEPLSSESRVPIQSVSPFPKSIGLDLPLMSRHNDRIHFITRSEQILNNIYIVTEISHHHEIPQGNRQLFSLQKELFQRDDFRHEMILAIKEKDGIVLFSGCCHNGILNMIHRANDYFGGVPIKGVVGGFHLIKKPGEPQTACTPSALEEIANIFIENNIKKIYTGHCTGRQAYDALKTRLGSRLQRLSTGKSFNI